MKELFEMMKMFYNLIVWWLYEYKKKCQNSSTVYLNWNILLYANQSLIELIWNKTYLKLPLPKLNNQLLSFGK